MTPPKPSPQGEFEGHTPGPWSIEDNMTMNDALWIGAEHPEVGFVSHAEVRWGCDEAEELGDIRANAHLIAASPTLYAYVTKRAEAGDQEAIQIVEAINASR